MTLGVIPFAGGDVMPVAGPGSVVLFGTWRPDSRALAFHTDDGIWLYDIERAQATDIFDAPDAIEMVAAWLPLDVPNDGMTDGD